MSRFYNDSIFWIEVDKIKPNPFQPRREFDDVQLRSLSDSIRQYGVLQALIVTRNEVEKEDGGMGVEYELVAGEGGPRAAPPAGLPPRARAFDRLVREFNFKHHEIGKKVGKSREYVSNSLRILTLPEYIINALSENKITEGHTRPLMMLIDRPQEQETLFKEILFKKLNVREAEGIARHIAVERARKLIDQELIDIEDQFKEKLGTRVRIEKKPD